MKNLLQIQVENVSKISDIVYCVDYSNEEKVDELLTLTHRIIEAAYAEGCKDSESTKDSFKRYNMGYADGARAEKSKWLSGMRCHHCGGDMVPKDKLFLKCARECLEEVHGISECPKHPKGSMSGLGLPSQTGCVCLMIFNQATKEAFDKVFDEK